MRQMTSNGYAAATANVQKCDIRVTVKLGDNVKVLGKSDIGEVVVSRSINGGEFSIGGTEAATMRLRFFANTSGVPTPEMADYTVEMGWDVNGTTEFVKLGKFATSSKDIVRNGVWLEVTGYDAFYWMDAEGPEWETPDGGSYKSAKQMMDTVIEYANAHGGNIVADTTTLSNTIKLRVYRPHGKVREQIGQIAASCGMNACFDGDGKLVFKKCSMTPSYSFGPSNYSIGGFEVTSGTTTPVGGIYTTITKSYEYSAERSYERKDDEKIEYVRPTGASGLKIAIPSDMFCGGTLTSPSQDSLLPSIETDIVEMHAVMQAAGMFGTGSQAFRCKGFSAVLHGFAFIDLLDCLDGTDPYGETHKLYAMQAEWKYNGGITTVIGSSALDEDIAVPMSAASVANVSKQINSVIASNIALESIVVQSLKGDNASFNSVMTGKLSADYAHITNGVIDNATINQASVNGLSANYAAIENGKIKNATIDAANVSNLNASVANLGYVKADQITSGSIIASTANITEQWVKDLMVQGKFVAQDGTAYNLTGLHIDANDITAGTLTVDRLMLQGEDGLFYKLNVTSMGQAAVTALTQAEKDAMKTHLHADTLLAHSITTDQITVNNLAGTGGWINLASGTFKYENTTTKNGISWDGSKLAIQADSFKLASGKTLEKEVADNIQIGGRNMLRNTDTFEDWTANNSAGGIGGIVVENKWNGKAAVATEIAWQGPNIGFDKVFPKYSIKTGDILTLSQWIMFDFAPVKDFHLSLYRSGEDNSSTGVISAECTIPSWTKTSSAYNILIHKDDVEPNVWYKIAFTFPAPSTLNPRCRIESNYYTTSDYKFGTNGERMYIAGCKFERGNKATDWTPADEDVDTRISLAETAIEQNEREISFRATKTEAQGYANSALADAKSFTTSQGYLTVDSDKITAMVQATADAKATADSKVSESAAIEIAKNQIKNVVISPSGGTTATQSADGFTWTISSPSVPTKVSQLANDSSFQTASQVSTTATTAANTAANNINVGGRNLVLNSANIVGGKLKGTSTNEYATINVGQSYMDAVDGEVVTISFDCEYVCATSAFYLNVYNSNTKGPVYFDAVSCPAPANFSQGNTIKFRGSVTTRLRLRGTSATVAYNSIEFYSSYNTGRFFGISNIKVERGNKATDWTPAPEDVDRSVADAAKTATSFMKFNASDGLTIGDYSSGSLSGASTNIKPDGMRIYDPSSNELAHFLADEARIANLFISTDYTSPEHPNHIGARITSHNMNIDFTSNRLVEIQAGIGVSTWATGIVMMNNVPSGELSQIEFKWCDGSAINQKRAEIHDLFGYTTQTVGGVTWRIRKTPYLTEAWASVTRSNASSTADGAWGYYIKADAVSYPTGLFTEAPMVQLSSRGPYGYPMLVGNGTAASTPDMYFYRPTAISGTTVVFDLYVTSR